METLNQIVLSSIKIGVCIAKCYCKEQQSRGEERGRESSHKRDREIERDRACELRC